MPFFNNMVYCISLAVAALQVCKGCTTTGPKLLTDCTGHHNTINNYYRQTASFYWCYYQQYFLKNNGYTTKSDLWSLDLPFHRP